MYVYRLDHLARSGIWDTFEVIEELPRHECQLVTVADGFDFAGPAAEVVLVVMAWAAMMERLASNERISAARARLEEEGRSWGRPPVYRRWSGPASPSCAARARPSARSRSP